MNLDEPQIKTNCHFTICAHFYLIHNKQQGEALREISVGAVVSLEHLVITAYYDNGIS